MVYAGDIEFSSGHTKDTECYTTELEKIRSGNYVSNEYDFTVSWQRFKSVIEAAQQSKDTKCSNITDFFKALAESGESRHEKFIERILTQ